MPEATQTLLCFFDNSNDMASLFQVLMDVNNKIFKLSTLLTTVVSVIIGSAWPSSPVVSNELLSLGDIQGELVTMASQLQGFHLLPTGRLHTTQPQPVLIQPQLVDLFKEFCEVGLGSSFIITLALN